MEARPHEVAILMLWFQGRNVKQIAYDLHYSYPQPVYRVLARWRDFVSSLEENQKRQVLYVRS